MVGRKMTFQDIQDMIIGYINCLGYRAVNSVCDNNYCIKVYDDQSQISHICIHKTSISIFTGRRITSFNTENYSYHHNVMLSDPEAFNNIKKLLNRAENDQSKNQRPKSSETNN